MNLLQASNILSGTERAANVAELEAARALVRATPRIQHDGCNWYVLAVGTNTGSASYCHLAACFQRQPRSGAFVQIRDLVDNAKLARAGAVIPAARPLEAVQ